MAQNKGGIAAKNRLSSAADKGSGLLMDAEVANSFQPMDVVQLRPGELYLFSRAEDVGHGSRNLLWGVYARLDAQGEPLLESATYDQRRFFCWQSLPELFDCFRPATRSELRDYFYNLALREQSNRWGMIGRE